MLAEDAVAAIDLPRFPSSAMDGFAVRAEDTPGELPIVGASAAGVPAERALEAREAMTIATGGVVPDGADAVVPIEHVTVAGEVVRVGDAVPFGANVRPRGGDVAAGERVLAAGTLLSASRLAALASAGVAEPRCARRPTGRGRHDGHRAPPARRGARGRSDLRVERRHARGPPGGRGRDRRAHATASRTTTTRIAPRSSGARRRRRRHVGRGLRRPARPRAPDLRRSSARRRCSGASRCGPGSHSRSPSAERRSSSASRAIPSPSLVGALLFVLPALRALQGERSPAPRFRLGILGASAVRRPRARRLPACDGRGGRRPRRPAAARRARSRT